MYTHTHIYTHRDKLKIHEMRQMNKETGEKRVVTVNMMSFQGQITWTLGHNVSFKILSIRDRPCGMVSYSATWYTWIPYWHVSLSPSSLFLIQLPTKMPGRQWVMAQALKSLSSTWDTQMEFLDPSFLALVPLSFGEWPSKEKFSLSLSLSFSLLLQIMF